MTIIGIDLGTTNSLAAWFGPDGPQLIPNALGEYLTPSVVGLDADGSILVGEAARRRLVTHPDITAARFKRRMGTEHVFAIGRNKFRAEDLSALVLKSLKADAEAFLEREVTEAIISVPAYFNEIQRKATIHAGHMAGLKVERLVNEPTAAALAYGLHDKDGESTFLVFDLGGGTFDVSILEMFDGVMEVRASAGDAFLGGEDFTDRLAEHFAGQMDKSIKELSPKALADLREVADRAKIGLSEEHVINPNIALGDDVHDLTIDRQTFEEINAELLGRLRRPVERSLRDTDLSTDRLDRVVLVGGGTRMQVIRQLVTKMMNRFPEHQIDPDQVVALGTAVQAGLKERHAALEDVVMTDICPFTLGIESARYIATDRYSEGHFSPIIERNSTIPVSRVEEFYTISHMQDRIEVKIYQGEAPKAADNLMLGSLEAKVPKKPAGEEGIDVRFTYDVNGILEVDVVAKSTGKKQSLVIQENPGALSDAEVQDRLKKLAKLKIHPRETMENRTVLARLQQAYEMSLGEKRDMVSHLLARFETVLAGQNTRDIDEARSSVNEALDQLDDHDVFQ